MSNTNTILRCFSALPVIIGMFAVVSLAEDLHEQSASHKFPSQASKRYFTVRDSIEMARFERANGGPKLSPDKRYIAIVTSRGLLRSNEIESTLWIVKSAVVKKLMQTDNVTKLCNPKILVRLAAIPKAQYPNSYEPVITNVQWLPDSKTIIFLGQDSQGHRILYEANVVSRSVLALTPKGYDILKVDFVGGNIACEVTQPEKNRSVGDVINSAARDVTGVRLTAVIFPQTDNMQKHIELWIVRNRKCRRIRVRNTGQPIYLTDLPPSSSVLSLSPSAKSVAVLVPSKTIPISWESYEPTSAYLKLHSNDSDRGARSWPAQYAVVDLKFRRTALLLDAPNGWLLGSADVNRAVWSSDGRKLLLTNTYLPLNVGEPERSNRLRRCIAAVVELASQAASCVAFSVTDDAKKHLIAASFGENDNDVVLRFSNTRDKTADEHYRYKDGTWRTSSKQIEREHQLPSEQYPEGLSNTLSVSVKQDLNTPPALWATDRESGRSKGIWDPNPQLAALDLGEASEFHWKDESGYEWIGGLVKPPNYIPGTRYPLVIQTHGYEANEFLTDGAYTTAFAARPLASVGIIVLQMPTRHDHMVSSVEALDQIGGFGSAVESLRAAGMIDPQRVGIIGFSRTCYYVESALIKDPNRFVAATLADGVDESYMNYLLFGVGRSQDEGVQIYGGTPFGDGLKNWTEHAPGFRLERVQAPVRIEAIAPGSLLQEWETYSSLSKQEKAVDLIYLSDGQHILQKPMERLASQQGNVDWFRFWLKGEEDSDRQKAEQYARWRRLRDQHSMNKVAQVLK